MSDPAGDESAQADEAWAPRARRRPGIVALVYVFRLVAAFVIAVPIAALAADTVGGYPRGDADLFDPGGLMLLEALRLSRAASSALTLQALLVAGLASIAGLAPLAALIHALGTRGRVSLEALGRAALRHLPTLAILFALATLAEGAAGVLIVMLGGSILGALQTTGRTDDLALAGIGLLAAVVVIVIGVVHDLARVAAVYHGRGFYRAAGEAVGLLRDAPLHVLGAYAWRGIATLALLAGAAAAAHGVGSASLGRQALAVIVHQAAILGAVALRASWLAAAMRAAGPPDARRGVAADEGEE